jgi:hypothetical protein
MKRPLATMKTATQCSPDSHLPPDSLLAQGSQVYGFEILHAFKCTVQYSTSEARVVCRASEFLPSAHLEIEISMEEG